MAHLTRRDRKVYGEWPPTPQSARVQHIGGRRLERAQARWRRFFPAKAPSRGVRRAEIAAALDAIRPGTPGERSGPRHTSHGVALIAVGKVPYDGSTRQQRNAVKRGAH